MSNKKSGGGGGASGSLATQANDLSQKLVKDGQKIFKETMPQKVLDLTKLIASDLFATPPDWADVEKDLNQVIEHPPPLPMHASLSVGGGRRKRRKIDKANHHMNDAASSDSENSEGSDHEGERKLAAPLPPVPCNKTVGRAIEAIKKELCECVEIVQAVKLWIQLCVPPIESGGQFSAGVQEECLNVLSRFEEQGYNLLDGITKYFSGRARIVSKLQRHPSVMDYRQTILELDQLEFMNLKNAAIELRNAYLVSYDVLTKNNDNLAPPRSMSSGMVV